LVPLWNFGKELNYEKYPINFGNKPFNKQVEAFLLKLLQRFLEFFKLVHHCGTGRWREIFIVLTVGALT
jgi:hypothetical protein